MASTLIERVIGAVRLDAATYEEVEADPTAMTQAMLVVVVASLAAGIGAGAAGASSGGMLGGAIGAVIGWFVWSATVYFVGTRLLPGPDTEADLGQLLRTTGFSAAPGAFGILGIVPGLGGLISLVAGIWQLAAMVVAVRQALDYETTGRAVLVCVVGFLAYLLVFFLILAILGGVLGTAGGITGTPGTVTP
jgi:hypothetical protein